MEVFDVHERACVTARDVFGAQSPQWIFHPDRSDDGWAHHGWHSAFADTPDTEKWLVVDLGRERDIAAVRLTPLFPYHDGVAIAEWRINGVFFPRALRVDVAEDPAFIRSVHAASWSDPVDRPESDFTPDCGFLGWHDQQPLVEPVTLSFAPVRARYVRVTATWLAGFESSHDGIKNGAPKRYAFALSGVSVFGPIGEAPDLAMGFDLLPAERQSAALRHLDWTLDFTGGRPTTGFVTTPLLLKTLSRFGRHARAVDLMLATRFPSFGYMIEHGATTIWERWDTDRWQGKQFMNDHNHRDFCGFVDWVWQCLVGLRPDLIRPGFARFTVAPQPDPRLSFVRARHRSQAGPIDVHWRWADDGFLLELDVPAGAEAVVRWPAELRGAPVLDGRPVGAATGIVVPAGRHTLRTAGIVENGA